MANRKGKKETVEKSTTTEASTPEGTTTSDNEPTTRAVEDIPEDEGYLGQYGARQREQQDVRTDPGVDNEAGE